MVLQEKKGGNGYFKQITGEAKSNDIVKLNTLRTARAQNRGRRVRKEVPGRKSPDRGSECCCRAENPLYANSQLLPVDLAAKPDASGLPHCSESVGETWLLK